MKLNRIAKAGVALTVVGLLIFLTVAIWLKTTRTTVLDIPMPMHTEEVIQDFTVDHDALYTVWVQFDQNVRLATARCLLGGHKSELNADLNCASLAPLLQFSWELSRDGLKGGTGSSADMGNSSTENNSLNVSIVTFPAQEKHRYTLTLKPNQNASGLKMSPPRVRVELDIFNREDFIWAGAAFDSIALLFWLIGGTMFFIPFLKGALERFF
jgi:hypothetical protein